MPPRYGKSLASMWQCSGSYSCSVIDWYSVPTQERRPALINTATTAAELDSGQAKPAFEPGEKV